MSGSPITHIHTSTHAVEIGSNEYGGDEKEEEAWLDALESGEVDERGYIPSKKSSALTARQVRAMHTCTFNLSYEDPVRRCIE